MCPYPRNSRPRLAHLFITLRTLPPAEVVCVAYIASGGRAVAGPSSRGAATSGSITSKAAPIAAWTHYVAVASMFLVDILKKGSSVNSRSRHTLMLTIV